MDDLTLPGAEAPTEDAADRLETQTERLAALAALLAGDDGSSLQSIPEAKQASVLEMLREIAAEVDQLAAEVVAELRAAQGAAA